MQEAIMTNKLYEWFDRLPKEACVFTARGGREMHTFFRCCLTSILEEKKYSPSPKNKIVTYDFVDLEEIQEQILTAAEDDGWGLEYEILRIHAWDINNEHLISKVIRKDTMSKNIDDSGSSVQSLTTALFRMSEEIRRVLKVVTEHNTKNLETITHLTQSVVSSEKSKIDLERENMTRELIMQLHEEDTGEDTRSQGLELLQRIAGGLFGQKEGGDIDEMIKETIKTNPDKVREYMQDPEVVEAIMKEAMRGKDEI